MFSEAKEKSHEEEDCGLSDDATVKTKVIYMQASKEERKNVTWELLSNSIAH